MQWLRAHPYAAALSGTAFLIVLGAFIVSNKSAVESGGSISRTWGGVGTNLFSPVSNTENQIQSGTENLYTEVFSGPPFHYEPTTASLPAPLDSDEDFNFDEFLAMLSSENEAAPIGTDTEGEDSLDVYSFIPSGLVSISSHTEERTEAQQKLFTYGNEVGSNIQTYEDIYRNAPQILKDQFEDRDNEVKNEALRQLAGGLGRVGQSLEAMEEVPDSVISTHDRVAASYRGMGDVLSQIPDAKSDQAMIDAMLAYNETVEIFQKNFISLAILLSAHGVTFTSDDPGSVFTFTQASF